MLQKNPIQNLDLDQSRWRGVWNPRKSFFARRKNLEREKGTKKTCDGLSSSLLYLKPSALAARRNTINLHRPITA